MRVPIKRNGLGWSKPYRTRQLVPFHEVRMVEKRTELHMGAFLWFQRLLDGDMYGLAKRSRKILEDRQHYAITGNHVTVEDL
jgi:hypothetical protein